MGMLSNLDVPFRLEISYFYSMQGSVTIPNEFHSRKILCISQVEYQKYIYPSNIVIPYTSRHSICEKIMKMAICSLVISFISNAINRIFVK